MCDTHLVIIHDIGKIIGWIAVSFSAARDSSRIPPLSTSMRPYTSSSKYVSPSVTNRLTHNIFFSLGNTFSASSTDTCLHGSSYLKREIPQTFRLFSLLFLFLPHRRSSTCASQITSRSAYSLYIGSRSDCTSVRKSLRYPVLHHDANRLPSWYRISFRQRLPRTGILIGILVRKNKISVLMPAIRYSNNAVPQISDVHIPGRTWCKSCSYFFFIRAFLSLIGFYI